MTRRDRIWKSKNATDLFEDQVPQFLQQISDLTQPFVTQHCLAGFVMQLSRRSSRYIFTYFIPRFLSNQQSSIIASHFQKYSWQYDLVIAPKLSPNHMISLIFVTLIKSVTNNHDQCPLRYVLLDLLPHASRGEMIMITAILNNDNTENSKHFYNNDSCSKYFLTMIIDACMNVDLIIKNLQKRYVYKEK